MTLLFPKRKYPGCCLAFVMVTVCFFIVISSCSDQDGAEPSANSVSALNLLRLSHLTGNKEWMQRSQQLLTAFSDRLMKVPIALPDMVRGLMAHHYTFKQVISAGASVGCIQHHKFIIHKAIKTVQIYKMHLKLLPSKQKGEVPVPASILKLLLV